MKNFWVKYYNSKFFGHKKMSLPVKKLKLFTILQNLWLQKLGQNISFPPFFFGAAVKSKIWETRSGIPDGYKSGSGRSIPDPQHTVKTFNSKTFISH
jgi:hypothetical protein